MIQHLLTLTLLIVAVTSSDLLDAAKDGDLELVSAIIEDGSSDIEDKSKDGYTALIYSVAKGHANVVKYLIEQGANVNAQDKDGVSALAYAMKKKHADIAQALKDAGATEFQFITKEQHDENKKAKKKKAKKGKKDDNVDPETWTNNVQILKDEDFPMFKQMTPRFLAMFYAPWCGHCKSAKPHYGNAAAESSLPLVALDCTSTGKATCAEIGVSGYPAFKYFDQIDTSREQNPSDYSGARTKSAFVKYLQKQDPDYVKPLFSNAIPSDWGSDTSGYITHLTDDHFDTYRQEKTRFLTMFYAPWCGHCKKTKPDFASASTKFRRSMGFAAMDCTTEGLESCAKYGIKSYPQFRYFGDDKSADPITLDLGGSRSSGDFVTFVEKQLDLVDAQKASLAAGSTDGSTDGQKVEVNYSKMRVKALRKLLKERGLKCTGCTDKTEFVKMVQENIHLPVKDTALKKSGYKKGGKTLMQEKRERVLKKEAAVGWSAETYGNGHVVHSYDGHFEETLLSGTDQSADQKKTFMGFFYAPWCGHCKAAKPDLVKTSTLLHEKYGEQSSYAQIVAVNAESSKELALKYGITSFPTYKLFRDGVVVPDKELSLMKPSFPPRGLKQLKSFMFLLNDPKYEPEPLGPFVNDYQKWFDDEEKKIHGSSSAEIDPNQDGHVIHMTDDHFDTYVKENMDDTIGLLVFFYAPWCGHCKNAKPHYTKAALQMEKTASGKTVKFLAMDCTSEGESTCQKYGVKGYPTIKWLDSGNLDVPEDYSGNRDTEGFLTYVQDKIFNSEDLVSEKEIKKEIDNEIEMEMEKDTEFVDVASDDDGDDDDALFNMNVLELAKTGNLNDMKRLLSGKINLIDLEVKSKDGYTALTYATAKGHLEIVQLLIENNANVNAVDKYGTSVLDYALKKKHQEIATMLEDAGAYKKEKGEDFEEL